MGRVTLLFAGKTYDTYVQNEREKQIVSMRFGLGGRREKTQKEVADLMGISQSYISRLEKRIMLRLRREISRQICS